MLATLAPRRLHYAWIVAAITFLILLVSAGVRSTPGVLLIPLEQEFGWDRATVSLAVSINLFLYGLSGPFAAAIMDRFGVRRVIVAALLAVAAGVGLSTQVRAAWQLYLTWGVVVGLGTGCMATVLGAMVANRWFVQRRGLVMGVLTASTATGQLVFLPLLASVAVDVSWRAAARVGCGAAAVMLPLALRFVRNGPRDMGLLPYGADPASVAEPTLTAGNPFAAAVTTLLRSLRSRDFLLLAGSFYVCGATTNGLIGTHLIPASVEHGIPEVTAASMLALIGVFDLIGTTASGWLSDRINSRWLLAWYYSLRGLALLFLPYAYGSGFFGLALFVVFYGLDWVATVPPTVRLTADLFGKQRVGTVYGWITAAHQLGAATAAFGAGALHTWFGDYQVSFMSAGVLALVAAGLVVRIGHLPVGDDGRPRRPLELASSPPG